MKPQLCKYGCGQEGIKRFKNGEWCCSENSSTCPINREKIANQKWNAWYRKYHPQRVRR